MANKDEKDEEKSENQVPADRFFHLIMANQRQIYGYILKLVPIWNDADDIFQETTKIMWKKFDKFVAGTDFVAWGINIARYNILNFRKKQSQRGNRVVFNSDLMKSIEVKAENADSKTDVRISALQNCIKKLNSHDRWLILLRYEQGMTTRKLADRIGIKIHSLYKIIPKIQNALLKCIRRTLATGKIA
ncbi:MAG: sigma-70 family RNA polymerase sigma factor [Sedimentisphaerales bacterium]|nr:sigma-70 family RNA polymerase sigma factor [Sedimentisphaerales bacterium]